MFLSLTTGDSYPAQAPVVKFNSKVNLPCVDSSNGKVKNSFKLFANWNPNTTMEQILIGLKQEMIANKGVKQPADGEMY